MQYTITVDTAAIAAAAGKDPSAVDHWLTGNAGTAEQMVTDALVGLAKDSGIAEAAPAPDPAVAPGAPGAPASGTAETDSARELAALNAAIDSLPPAFRDMVRDHLDAELSGPGPSGVGV